MIKPKVVLLIFVSGKIVLTGAKVRSSSCASSHMLMSLRSARRSTPPSTRYTPCFANSASHRLYILIIPPCCAPSRMACPTTTLHVHHLSLFPPTGPCGMRRARRRSSENSSRWKGVSPLDIGSFMLFSVVALNHTVHFLYIPSKHHYSPPIHSCIRIQYRTSRKISSKYLTDGLLSVRTRCNNILSAQGLLLWDLVFRLQVKVELN